MVCSSQLTYLNVGESLTCVRCNTTEIGHVVCQSGHYICNDCHSLSTSDVISKLIMSNKSNNPLEIAESVLKYSNPPMLGCEHALITCGALLKAIKNTYQYMITDQQIYEAFNRTKKQAIAAYCGLTGICGIAPAIGAVFSIITGAACPKDKETSLTMHVVSKIVTVIANETGPCCCKNFMRSSIPVACSLLDEHLGIKLLCAGNVKCEDSNRHPHGCRQDKCLYYI